MEEEAIDNGGTSREFWQLFTHEVVKQYGVGTWEHYRYVCIYVCICICICVCVHHLWCVCVCASVFVVCVCVCFLNCTLEVMSWYEPLNDSPPVWP